MSAKSILLLYIIFFLAEFIWEQIVTLLNIYSVHKNRKKIPHEFDGYIHYEKYKETVEYTKTKSVFGIINCFVTSAFLLGIILSGSLGGIEVMLRNVALPEYIHGIVYIFVISLLFTIIQLPFDYYAQFYIEEKYGFNTMEPKLFFLDILKSLMVSAGIMVPMLWILFWFLDTTGNIWWLYAFAFIVFIQFGLSIVYPLVKAPLFNKFTPLQESGLREQIEMLVKRLGFKIKGIFVMDSSKRSKHSNAYFTGLGRAKRIVLFDTLLERLGEDRILAVLAHEIGHVKKKHLYKGILINLVLLAFSLFVIEVFLEYGPLYQAFGFTAPSYHAIFVILAFCSGPFTFFLKPFLSVFSRRFEYQADAYAVKAIGYGKDLKEALLTLGKENLTNMTPHPLYSFYHYSHPTLAERIRAMEQVENR